MQATSRLSLEKMSIRELISEIASGEIKVPQFQRGFVWSSQQALSLLDSIANNYPIGSILLWRTAEVLPAARNIGDFQLPDVDASEPTNYVLDGQQRLTVIYSCLGASINERGFAAAYDLEKERFVEQEHEAENQQQSFLAALSSHIVPLRILFTTSAILDFRFNLQSHPNSESLQNRLILLIQAFEGYQVPVIELKKLTVEEVCPIFERINSSGTRLSVYELLVAATWSKGFDLNNEVRHIAQALEVKGFGDLNGDTIVKCLAAIHSKSVNREDILSLRKVKPQIKRFTSLVTHALIKSVDFLSTELQVYSWEFLPYEAIIVILSVIFSEIDTLDVNQIRRVREWFWRSSFSERYRGAADSFISSDIRLVRDYVINNSGIVRIFGENPDSLLLTQSEFRSTNSRSRAFILALAAKNPRSLVNGTIIDTSEALSIFNKKQFHHIYPKAFLIRTQTTAKSDALANICMLPASANRFISDSSPNLYLPRIIQKLGKDAEDVFDSNLLPDPSIIDYSNLDYVDFLQRRALLLSDAFYELCSGNIL